MINICVKNEREKEKEALLLPRSFKYLDLSKNIKESSVHVIFKDGLLSCFFTYRSPPWCRRWDKIYLSANVRYMIDMQISDVSDIMSTYFRWISSYLIGDVAISQIQNSYWVNVLTNRLFVFREPFWLERTLTKGASFLGKARSPIFLHAQDILL